MMRTARDYICGLGEEAVWNRPPRRFRALRLLAEDLRMIGHYEGRRALADDRIAASRLLVRTHVEGGLALAAGHGVMHRMLPLIVGGSWSAPDADNMTRLAADGGSDAVSLSLIRRLASRDDWQLFSGLRVQRLGLFPGADGGLQCRVTCLGGTQQAQSGLTTAGAGPATSGLRLAAPASGLQLHPVKGGDVGTLFLAGFEISLVREGMRPHFALGTSAPQLITPGLLVAQVGLRLLANDAAKAASLQDHLGARFRFEDATGHTDLAFATLRVVARRETADVGGGPAQVQLALRAEISDGSLLHLTTHRVKATAEAVSG